MRYTVEQVARVVHEANRAFCQTVGDDTQPPWDDAPVWQRDAAIKAVEFCLARPDAGPEANHEEWLRVKRAEGWEYGGVKDPDRKTHPCIVPFDQLPVEQRKKDALIAAVVAALADLVEHGQ